MPTEEISIRDLVKHPRLIIVYVCFVGIGWVSEKFFPDDCHKANERLELQNIQYLKRGDSIQATKDQLYERYLVQRESLEELKQTQKLTDSLLFRLGDKAGHILNKKSHVK